MSDFHAGLTRAVSTAHGLFRRFARLQAGGVAVIVALSMPVFVGAMAMAIDAGVWYAHARVNQDAADAVAYSAGVNYAYTGSTAKAIATGKAIAAAYGVANGSNAGAGPITWTLHIPSASGTNSGVAGSVEAIINRPENLFFSGYYMSRAGTAGRAVGTANTLNQYCILALDTSSTTSVLGPPNGTTFYVNNAANISSPNCGAAINGPSSNAVYLTSGAVLNANPTYIVGNYATVAGSAGTVTNAVKTGAAIADPYASVPIATPACAAGHSSTNYFNQGTVSSPFVVPAGTYCGGLNFYNCNVRLSGIYIIDGGYFTMASGSTAVGTGVTIELTGDANYTPSATLFILGGTTTLSAPTTGTTAGIVFYANRTFSDHDTLSSPAYIGSGATLNINGAIYLPSQMFYVANGTTITNTVCPQMIAYDFRFDGGITYTNTCTMSTANGTTAIGASSTKLAE